MFNFYDMIGNYEDRTVGRDNFDWGFVSTARVTDGDQPYETAVCSSEYAREDDPDDTEGMIIVEAYNDAESAKTGHDKWVLKMTGDNPPTELVDCLNAGIGQLAGAFGEIKQVRVTS